MNRLIGVVITRNEQEHIADCLRSLAFCDAQLVLDSFSTDDTAAIAHSMGASVRQRAFDHFAAQRNAALAAAAPMGEWVLFVDADERVPAALAEEVRSATADRDAAGFRIPRDNYLFGRLTRGAGWFPDYQTRLLRVGKAWYDEARPVHELAVLDGAEGTLHHALVHYNYRDVRQFHEKQRRYVAYEARILYDSGIRPRPWTYLTQPLRHVWWRFVTLHGHRDGLHGLHLSALMGWYEFRKYWLLRQMLRSQQP